MCRVGKGNALDGSVRPAGSAAITAGAVSAKTWDQGKGGLANIGAVMRLAELTLDPRLAVTAQRGGSLYGPNRVW